MLDAILSAQQEVSHGLLRILLIMGASLLLGVIISLVYMWTHKKEGYASSFPVTLIMLPVIIAIIIYLVGNDVARAFSLAGAFSLIRFRSAPGDPKDIAYVFFTLAVGLACGMCHIGYAAIFVLVLCGVMILLTVFRYAVPRADSMTLKITVPENINYQGMFDDILLENTVSYQLIRVRTIEFGALFEVVYHVILKKDKQQKNFIDELRSRNGNLKIALTMRNYEE